MSGNISNSGADSVEIDSPVASMGVRGTIVEGLIGPQAIEFAQQADAVPQGSALDTEGATLFVLRGPGRRNKGNDRTGEISVTSAGETVTLRDSGMAVFVGSENSPPSAPFRLTDQAFTVFNTSLRTAPVGGPSYRPFPLDASMQYPARKSLSSDRTETDFIDPETDMDWPTENDQFQRPNQPGQFICNPYNPNFPQC